MIKKKYIYIIVSISILVLLSLYLYPYIVGYYLGKSMFKDEIISIVPSPDNIVEALLVRRGSGSTSSEAHIVYIAPILKKNTKKRHEIFIADHVKNIRIEWRKNKHLNIIYEKARIFKFSNFWNSTDLQNYKYTVEIRLLPLSSSSF